MYRLLLILPRCVQKFLLSQPLPDQWVEALQQKLDDDEEDKDPYGHKLDLSAGWKQSYNLILAMVILCLSAMVMYLILR